MEFEWDEAKNQSNILKHGIGFDTAKRVFDGRVATSANRRRDHGEDRNISIGQVKSGAVIVEPDRTDQITMRVKRSVLAYFKAPGKKGYQTRMNRVLESYVRHRTEDRSPPFCGLARNHF